MQKKFIIFLVLILCVKASAEKKPEISYVRQKIGPVYAPPVQFQNSIYFIGSSGALYSSDFDQVKVKELFKMKLRSVAEPLLNGTTLYFGDGLHEDENSNLYAYDLVQKKIKFSISIDGHVEKKPAIFGDFLIVGLGPAGIAAFNKQTGKVALEVKKIGDKNLHVDSSPIVRNGHIYFTSIYSYKAIIGMQASDGKVLWKHETSKSPKADLVIDDDYIVSLASEGGLTTEEREIPSELVVLRSKTGDLISKKELRGSNYFPQMISKNEIFIALSTGDIISVEITSGKMAVVDQYPEPFLASTFFFNDSACAISVAGRLFCYKNKKLTYKKELGEINIGKVSDVIHDRVYLPSRAGFFVLTKW